jgi:hypothetical protein
MHEGVSSFGVEYLKMKPDWVNANTGKSIIRKSPRREKVSKICTTFEELADKAMK